VVSSFLELVVIQFHEFFRDGLIQFGQAEEGKISQSGENPAFGDQDRRFHFGFIFGFADSGWNHHGAVMFGDVLIGGIEIRFVAAGMGDTCF